MPTRAAAPRGFRALPVSVTAWLGRFPLPLVQLLFRLAMAGVFLKAGLQKTARRFGCSIKMQDIIYRHSVLKLLAVTGQDMVHKHYNIGQLAQAAGIPISTLRYYERVGLLQPTGRTRSNYRFYTQDTLHIVRFIRAAQATGFTLEDVRTLLTLWHGQSALCKDVQPLVAKRLAEVTQRLQDMQHILRILTSMLAMCHAQEQNAPCPVIDKLTEALSSPLHSGAIALPRRRA